jgi:hypothetical protein
MHDTTDTTDTAAIDNLTWDDWTAAAVCAIENGAECAACEG